MTRTQYAILASALPRISEDDLRGLLDQMDNVEAERHTLVGVVSSILPRLQAEDFKHLRELIVMAISGRQDAEKGGLHVVEVEIPARGQSQ